MTDMLSITRTNGPVPVLHLAGRLTANTEADLVAAARTVRESGMDRLVVDLTGIEMLTSAGLRGLHAALLLFAPLAEVEAFQKANPGQQFKSPSFKLAGATPHVHSILSMAGFLHTIPIYPDLEQAIASFTP